MTPRLRAALALALPFVFFSVLAAAKKPLAPEEVLRRAEDARLASGIYAVEVALRSYAPSGKSPERNATFSAAVEGRGAALLVRHTPKIIQGSAVLFEGDVVRTLPVRGADVPSSIDDGQLMLGEPAAPALWRLDLAKGFQVKDLGEETFDGVECRKLALLRESSAKLYRRAEYWISKRDLLPKRIDYYGSNPERLLHRVRYGPFEKGPLGLRPTRMISEGGNPWEETVEITFSNYRKLDLRGKPLTLELMKKVRDEARPKGNPKNAPDFVLEDALKAALQ